MSGLYLAGLVILIWIIVGFAWLHIAYEMLEKEFKWYDKLIVLPAVVILLIIIEF